MSSDKKGIMCLARLYPLICSECERIGWSQENLIFYIGATFQKTAILQLTDTEAEEIIQYLGTLESA